MQPIILDSTAADACHVQLSTTRARVSVVTGIGDLVAVSAQSTTTAFGEYRPRTCGIDDGRTSGVIFDLGCDVRCLRGLRL